MNHKEKQKFKNEIKLSIYNQLIESIMSEVNEYEDLSKRLQLKVHIIMRHSKSINAEYVS